MRNINIFYIFSAANIDFSAKYTSDSRFLASSQLSGDGRVGMLASTLIENRFHYGANSYYCTITGL